MRRVCAGLSDSREVAMVRVTVFEKEFFERKKKFCKLNKVLSKHNRLLSIEQQHIQSEELQQTQQYYSRCNCWSSCPAVFLSKFPLSLLEYAHGGLVIGVHKTTAKQTQVFANPFC